MPSGKKVSTPAKAPIGWRKGDKFYAPNGRVYGILSSVARGDCLFHSFNRNNDPHDAATLRRQCARTMLIHEHHYRPLIEEAGGQFNAVLSALMTPGEWAGEEALHALVDATGDEIWVYVEGGTDQHIRRFSPSPNYASAQPTGNVRVLLFDNVGHYDALEPYHSDEEEEEEYAEEDKVEYAEEDKEEGVDSIAEEEEEEYAEEDKEEGVDSIAEEEDFEEGGVDSIAEDFEEGGVDFFADDFEDDGEDFVAEDEEEEEIYDAGVEDAYAGDIRDDFPSIADVEESSDDQMGLSGSYERDEIPAFQETLASRGSPVQMVIGAVSSGIGQARRAVSRALNGDFISPEDLNAAFESGGQRQGQGRHDSTLRGSPVGVRTRSRKKNDK